MSVHLGHNKTNAHVFSSPRLPSIIIIAFILFLNGPGLGIVRQILPAP